MIPAADLTNLKAGSYTRRAVETSLTNEAPADPDVTLAGRVLRLSQRPRLGKPGARSRSADTDGAAGSPGSRASKYSGRGTRCTSGSPRNASSAASSPTR
ncbi:MAG: hypothetical protein M0C28_24460 [Candidatus Moduliflexus flocculans]|nr:hypothetical protein [Candidatus Moduliflexus flocculans]